MSRPWFTLLLLGSLLSSVACDPSGSKPVDDTGLVDADGDGYGVDDDCDDEDPAAYPGAEEVCDGADNDCDGEIDEEGSFAWYPDADSDGYGGDDGAVTACEAPEGYLANDGDCDDADPAVNPDAVEACNGVDDDCDGVIDEDPPDVWYADTDADGYGDLGSTTKACGQPSGYVADSSDCDDADPAVNPAATELCNGVDDDCDGSTDEDDADDASAWYADSDSDGYGDASSVAASCAQPSGHVDNDSDCDDSDAAINPAALELCDGVDNDCDGVTDEDDADDVTTWYADGDSDGYGDPASGILACSQPSGHLADSTDCDDSDAAINPVAIERCDGVDNDCDGVTDEGDAVDASTWYADLDVDGYGDPASSVDACSQPSGYVAAAGPHLEDCDDTTSAVNPGATELCDGVDNDCDGSTDEDDADDAEIWYADADSDGYGDPATGTEACAQPSGHVDNDSDCDDAAAGVNPGVDELCNGVDDDCDGDIDEDDALDSASWHADSDGDGYGDPASSTLACSQPSGHVASGIDCDDADAAVHPGATELCNGVDDDCDGTLDEGDAADADTWYADMDSDSYGDAGNSATACSQPSGYLADDSDCDDSDAAVNPSATELCDGVDNDCDGDIDEASAPDAGTWYADADGDGYGDASASTIACAPPSGYVADDTDCDDTSFSIHPGAAETWYNGVDSDCSGGSDYDRDGDGYDYDAYGGADCDDGDASTNPGATEVWYDGVDSDCDGANDYDADSDGYDHDGYGGSDCDDTDAGVNPGATDAWYDGVDSDCGGDSDYDADLDGHDSDAYGGDDCDDTDIAVNPSELESCDGVDNDCDGDIDEDDGAGGLCDLDFVLFVTDTHVDSGTSTWHDDRDDADAYCAAYAASNGISGTDFRVVYSTPTEDAKDFLDYSATLGDRVFDRYGTQVDGGDLWGSGSVSLPDMQSYTITGTQNDGTFVGCSGPYSAGSWPICQWCSLQFTCGSSSSDPFNATNCCYTGTRAIVCMGAL
jgi:hypothetical protein